MAVSDSELIDIEARMRPGRLSRAGFLGSSESLRDVLGADAAAIERIGATFEALGQALERLLAAATASRSPDAVVIGDHRISIQRFLGFQFCPWSPDPRRPQCGRRGNVYSSVDWTIENLKIGKSMAGPGLIVHLMLEHGFCEGFESPYRVDPVALAQVLGLASG